MAPTAVALLHADPEPIGERGADLRHNGRSAVNAGRSTSDAASVRSKRYNVVVMPPSVKPTPLGFRFTRYE